MHTNPRTNNKIIRTKDERTKKKKNKNEGKKTTTSKFTSNEKKNEKKSSNETTSQRRVWKRKFVCDERNVSVWKLNTNEESKAYECLWVIFDSYECELAMKLVSHAIRYTAHCQMNTDVYGVRETIKMCSRLRIRIWQCSSAHAAPHQITFVCQNWAKLSKIEQKPGNAIGPSFNVPFQICIDSYLFEFAVLFVLWQKAMVSVDFEIIDEIEDVGRWTTRPRRNWTRPLNAHVCVLVNERPIPKPNNGQT